MVGTFPTVEGSHELMRNRNTFVFSGGAGASTAGACYGLNVCVCHPPPSQKECIC